MAKKEKKAEATEDSTPVEAISEPDTRTAVNEIQLARHADRPTRWTVERLFDEFVEMHGDRRFADDRQSFCGSARFHAVADCRCRPPKGRDTKQRKYRNFGMPKPEVTARLSE